MSIISCFGKEVYKVYKEVYINICRFLPSKLDVDVDVDVDVDEVL